jgi:hypothetical protein
MVPVSSVYAEMAQQIQEGEPAGIEGLSAQFGPGLRFLLGRFVCPVEALGLSRQALASVVRAIQGGELSQPARLPALVRAEARRVLRERQAARTERVKEPRAESIAGSVLRSIPSEGQEALRRYYLDNQSPQRVCAELNLSPERFRLLKSQARREFKAGLAHHPLPSKARATQTT